MRDTEPVAVEMLNRIAAIYRIEEGLTGKSPDERLTGRRAFIMGLLTDLRAYLMDSR